MNIGDKVKIKAPFNAAFPAVYEIVAVAEAPNTFAVNVHGEVSSDFNLEYLEIA